MTGFSVLRKVVFRLGVIELEENPDGTGEIRYYNRTAEGGPYTLSAEATARWKAYLDAETAARALRGRWQTVPRVRQGVLSGTHFKWDLDRGAL
jgi:hypothetical protein